MNLKGLRWCADHFQTRCCGREAIKPYDGDGGDCNVAETDEGTPIDREHFPDAEYVCPDCLRTWGEVGCDHDSVMLFQPSNPKISEGKRWFSGKCRECDEQVNILVSIQDVREVDE